jgi:hypothetical protein
MRMVNCRYFSIGLLVLTNSEALQRVGDPLESGDHLLEPVEYAATHTSPGRASNLSEDGFPGACSLLRLISESDIQLFCFLVAIVVTIFMIGSFRCPVDPAVPGALPLVVKDSVVTDEHDTVRYVSTGRLRKSFEFNALLSDANLHPRDVYPSGDLIVIDAPVCLLAEHFPYLTKKQLVLWGRDHTVDFVSGARKEVYRHLLLEHACSAACTRTPFVFKLLSHARLESSKPTYPSSEELEQHKRQRIESRRHKQNVRRVARVQARARDIVESQLSYTRSALTKFPPEVTVKERNAIIAEWMDEMDLSKFTQKSCAVCGQRRCAKDIKLVSPADINFTLLRNPYLPSKSLPTNYNMQAYDDALLWHKGLHDTVRKDNLDMCILCYHELVTLGKQPLDSLANFQYYGHEALPVEIRKAFEQATTFDIMMVARA